MSYKGQAGGSGRQLNTVKDVELLLENKKHQYWSMSNGYLLPTQPKSLAGLCQRISSEEPTTVGGVEMPLFEAMIAAQRIGIHWDTEVVRSKKRPEVERHRVCQCFCSAVPVSYGKSTNSKEWEPLARVCLSGAYEATLAAAAILAHRRGERIKVFLTSVGGGAFGNRSMWIVDALGRALAIHKEQPIDVYLVHYERVPKGDFQAIEKGYKKPPKIR